jgi:hypothetical protein
MVYNVTNGHTFCILDIECMSGRGGKSVSLPIMSQPSPAELLEEARRKAREELFLLFDEVRVQIDNLRKMKEKKSRKYPERDFVTIADVDLTNALHTGVLERVERCTHDPGWVLDLNGSSTDGTMLALSIYLPDEGPLAFMSFALLPPERS